MKYKGLAVVPALMIVAGVVGCDVDVEEKGRLPEVDVDVKEGKLPDISVRGPEVDVGTKQVEVAVPTVDVRLPRENDPTPKNDN